MSKQQYKKQAQIGSPDLKLLGSYTGVVFGSCIREEVLKRLALKPIHFPPVIKIFRRC